MPDRVSDEPPETVTDEPSIFVRSGRLGVASSTEIDPLSNVVSKGVKMVPLLAQFNWSPAPVRLVTLDRSISLDVPVAVKSRSPEVEVSAPSPISPPLSALKAVELPLPVTVIEVRFGRLRELLSP